MPWRHRVTSSSDSSLASADRTSASSPPEDCDLIDACLNRNKNLAVRHELIWGDYFLLETWSGLYDGLDTT